MFSMQFDGENSSRTFNLLDTWLARPRAAGRGELTMNELGMYLGRDGESARGWVYDDGLVVWVASAEESLGQIRSEFGCVCVAVLRYETLGERSESVV